MVQAPFLHGCFCLFNLVKCLPFWWYFMYNSWITQNRQNHKRLQQPYGWEWRLKQAASPNHQVWESVLDQRPGTFKMSQMVVCLDTADTIHCIFKTGSSCRLGQGLRESPKKYKGNVFKGTGKSLKVRSCYSVDSKLGQESRTKVKFSIVLSCFAHQCNFASLFL